MFRNPSFLVRTLAPLAVVVSGCISSPPTDPDASGVGEVPQVPTSIHISPTSVSLTVGQEYDFAAVVEDQNGKPAAMEVKWKATGGDITSHGRFKAKQKGRHKVIGEVSPDLADTAVVDIEEAPSSQPKPPSGNVPPEASFTVSCEELTCSLDGRATSDSDGQIAESSWAFGDGSTDTGLQVEHTYGSAGDYQVQLAVTDDDGATDEVTHTAVATDPDTTPPPATNEAPTAAWTYSCDGLTCTFDGSSSSDDGSIVDFDWWFEGGGGQHGMAVEHTFGAEGTYSVVLTVTDDGGLEDGHAQEVDVGEAPPPPTGDAQPNGPAGSWTLALDDEFDALNSGTWTKHYAWWPTTINGELQYFDPNRPYVSGGTLKLTADRTAQSGMDYTSGAISSHGKFAFTYGVAEMRAKLPVGKGLWPAFWTMPEGGGWPPEIDVMENIGEQNRVYMNLHFAGGGQMGAVAFSGLDVRQWHTYTVEWASDRMTWYVDGVQRATHTDASHIPQQDMYLLLNLAVGGSWPGSPDGSTVFPATYEVDYVRVWQ